MNFLPCRLSLSRSCAAVAAFVLGIASLFGATVETIQVRSDAMKKDVPALVILPEGCGKSEKHFPVLYLLHGYGGDYRTWARIARLDHLADRYGVIIVCPDGGIGSWYLDSPEDPAWRYETFVAKELLSGIDGRFPTLPRRESRAIAGFSMGGHGAFFLAFRHPEVFGTAVSFSGGVDLRPFPGNWEIAKRLGTIENHPDRWKEFSVITQAEKAIPGRQALAIDCGVDDFFLQVNRNLHALLLARGVPHDYTERPGGHTADYWEKAVRYQMPFVSDHLAR